MDLKAFELMTKEEKVDFLVQERIDYLKGIEAQEAQVKAAQQKADALNAYEAESEVAIEAVRVARYKGKLALVESLKEV